jgi:hypothetical protein
VDLPLVTIGVVERAMLTKHGTSTSTMATPTTTIRTTQTTCVQFGLFNIY